MSENQRPSDEIIAKIRKILTKTEEASCTKEEAASAFAMATKLMAQYNLEMSDLEVKGDETVTLEWQDDEVIAMARWRYEDQLAYSVVVEFCFVEGFFLRQSCSNKKSLNFFGTKANVESAKFMFTALLAAYDRLWATHRLQTDCPAHERRIYVAGVATGFQLRLRGERKAMEAERDIIKGKTSGSTALALISVKQQTATAYLDKHPEFKKKNGEKKTGRSTTFAPLTGDHDTFAAGLRDGKNLSLHRSVGAAANAGVKQLDS